MLTAWRAGLRPVRDGVDSRIRGGPAADAFDAPALAALLRHRLHRRSRGHGSAQVPMTAEAPAHLLWPAAGRRPPPRRHGATLRRTTVRPRRPGRRGWAAGGDFPAVRCRRLCPDRCSGSVRRTRRALRCHRRRRRGIRRQTCRWSGPRTAGISAKSLRSRNTTDGGPWVTRCSVPT